MKKLNLILMALCLNVLVVPAQQVSSVDNNFRLNIHVSEGVDDSGYLIHVFNHVDKPLDRLANLPVEERECSFTTYLDDVYLADVIATSPADSAWTHIRFPFVPGETAELKVMNGSSCLSGTGFYKQWMRADALVENVRNNHTEEETDSMLTNYLKEHGSEEGCAMYYLQNNILPLKTMRELIPSTVWDGQFKKIISMFYFPDEDDVFEKLPGFEKHEDGSITINGKPVKKIIIDGKVIHEE